MLVCVFLCASCTRDRGCSAHPAFPAPSVFGGQASCKARAHRAARMRSHIQPSLRASAKQSIFLSVAKWIASLTLAMTMWGCIRGSLKFESERMIEPWLARRPKPQNGEVRLRARFARLRRTRIALSVLRGCATRSPQGRSVVPLAGIEPALLAELDFESSASTNSATGAFGRPPEGQRRKAGGI